MLIDKPELLANISFLLSFSGYTSIEGRQRVSAYCSHSGFQAGRGAHFQILLVPSLDCKKDLILAIKWSGPEVTHFASPYTTLPRTSHVAPLPAKGAEMQFSMCQEGKKNWILVKNTNASHLSF